MKLSTLITTAGSVTATAFAGVSSPVIQAPAPTLGGWFVGGTYGQLDTDSNGTQVLNNNDPEGFLASYNEGDLGPVLAGYSEGQPSPARLPSGNIGDHYEVSDFEFDMYTLHIGRDLGKQVLGCDLAAYLEVGFLDGNANTSFFNSGGSIPPIPPTNISISTSTDIDIIPITMNLKLERPFYGPISGYITGGVGYAFTDIELDSESDSGGGFYAQASIGLIYNINASWEIFGGARYVHLSSLDFGDNGIELDDNIAYEIGARYNF
jgi:opacity protein-like surface antigen